MTAISIARRAWMTTDYKRSQACTEDNSQCADCNRLKIARHKVGWIVKDVDSAGMD